MTAAAKQEIQTIERRVRDLTNCVDDLTTLAYADRNGHILRASFPELLASMRKLYDLVLDLQQSKAA